MAPKKRVAASTAAIRTQSDVAGHESAATSDRSALLSIRGVAVSYALPSGDERDVVQDVDIDVDRGEVLGLVGESGSGKTQTAFAVLGCCPEAVASRPEASVSTAKSSSDSTPEHTPGCGEDASPTSRKSR
ncbi:ATP-binding cassette domain-containing protein [Microbacterium sp. NIBRBAC000506063]|uniref:ATP-binding cassette domain-containing protein n=1 Tax=Microbacterium sp. NIBRBAC000506063 TaxID=2734618 RepID=UPI001CB6B817|nr:ATP-binding cassette domain-containing protein [Microbacterium sp. NIBRBAC000506063]